MPWLMQPRHSPSPACNACSTEESLRLNGTEDNNGRYGLTVNDKPSVLDRGEPGAASPDGPARSCPPGDTIPVPSPETSRVLLELDPVET